MTSMTSQVCPGTAQRSIKKLGMGWMVVAMAALSVSAADSALKGAGDLLIGIDAADYQETADGAALGAIANTGTLGGTFVPLVGKAGAVYSANVAGSPAFTFAGTDSIMTNTVLPEARMLGGSPWSVEAWVYNPAYTTSIETYLSWTPREGFSDNARTVMECRYCATEGYAVEHYTTNLGWGGKPARPACWHFLVMTHAADGTERFYVDGRLRTEVNIALRLRDDGQITLGGVYNAAGKSWSLPFTGSLAKLRVHSGTLTSEQVINNYEHEVGTLIPRWQGAIGAWDDPANWVGGVVPSDVLIDNGGTATFTSGTVNLTSLLAPNGGISIADGAKVVLNRALHHIHFGQGPGSSSSLSITAGELRQIGTNDTQIYISGLRGTGRGVVGGGTEPARLISDRDLFVSYLGSTGELEVGANGLAAPSNGWLYVSHGAGSTGALTVNGGVVGALSETDVARNLVIANAGSSGTLELNAGTVYAKGSLDFSRDAKTTTGRAVFRMNGGEAYVKQFLVGATAADNQIAFNGGVVHAVSTQASYMKNFTRVTVAAGGVTFDVPAGVTVTIDQALLEDAESTGGVLHKTGAGRLVLAGANTLSTVLDLQEGEVLFSNADALAAFPGISAAVGTAVGGTWEGGPAAVLSKLDLNASVTLILTAANAADNVDFTGRPNMVFKTEGTFSYTGTFTPAVASTVMLDVGTSTMTYGISLADDGETPASLTVRGEAGGKLIVTGANTFTGGLVVDGATVQFASATTVPSVGTITLRNHAQLDFMLYQDIAPVVARLTAGSDGLLILHDPTEITANLDLSNLPGIVLGTATNLVYSGTLTPGGSEYHLGGGRLSYTGPHSGLKLTTLADVGGPTRVVVGDPGMAWLAAGNTYSGGTIVTNKGILYLASGDGLGAVPAEDDPDNLFLDGGIVRGGNGTATIAATRGVTIGAGGATFHQWGSPTLTFLGSLHGSGKMTMMDSGWVTFAGVANDYTGELVVSSGANTRIGNGQTFSWQAETGATISGRLALMMNQDVTLGQTFSGSGILRKEGTGTLTLTGRQNYGKTQVAEGTLRVADASVLPSGGSKGTLQVESTGVFDTDGKGVVVAALEGVGQVTNRTDMADTLHIDSTSVTGDFQGVLAASITVEKTGASRQAFTAEEADSAPVPALVLKDGVVELNKWQKVNRLVQEGGTLHVKNGSAGLLGRYYVPASMSTAATTLSSLANIAAFEAANVPNLLESCTTMGTTFDTGPEGSRFPSAYRSKDNYMVIWRGVILIPEEGNWTFALCSDDGSVLYLDNEKLVDNLKDQGYTANNQRVATRATVTLTKGMHDIVIGFYEKTGSNAVTAYITRPGATADEVLPTSMLYSMAPNAIVTVRDFEATDGVISFDSDGVPVLRFAQDTDFTLSIPVTGDNREAVLEKGGTGTLTVKGMQNDFNGTFAVSAGTAKLDAAGGLGVAAVATGAKLALAEAPTTMRKGLSAKYYTNVSTFDYANITDYERMEAYFASLTPAVETDSLTAGDTLDFGTTGAGFTAGMGDYFLLYLSGHIYLPEGGTWSFAVDSDDGATVWIDGMLAVSRALDTGLTGNNGTKGSEMQLAGGLHTIRVAFREKAGDQSLRVAWKGPSYSAYAFIPQENLYRTGNMLRGLSGEAGAQVNLANGMLMLAQDRDTTYAGALVGTADSVLLKSGTGTLSLTGACSEFAGGIDVTGGTVRFAQGGTVNLAHLFGSGRVVVDGGTDLVVAESDFTGAVEVLDGTFTVGTTGTSYLSNALRSVSGETVGVTGTGSMFFDLAADQMQVQTVKMGGSARGVVANEAQLGGANVELAGGTLQLQRTMAPGTTVLADMSANADWQFNNNAVATTLDGKPYYRLTACGGSLAGSAFYKTKINLTRAWHASFTYHVATNGTAPADGFSFMLQNQAVTACGGSGGCTGGAIYENAEKAIITPAVAVNEKIYNSAELGIYQNGSAMTGGARQAMAGFDRTKDVDYTITYDGVWLSITAQQGEKSYTRTQEVDLATVLGETEAWIGFTAGTGGSYAEQGVLNVEVREVAAASGDFSGTALSVVSNDTGTVTSQFEEVSFEALTLAEGATLDVAASGVGANVAYALAVGTLSTATNTTLRIAANGTGRGTLALGVLDCRAGSPLKVTGGSLTAKASPLTIIVPTPLPTGVIIKLVDLTESGWTGPFNVLLVDADGNPVKARAILSGGVIKVSTSEGTMLYFR